MQGQYRVCRAGTRRECDLLHDIRSEECPTGRPAIAARGGYGCEKCRRRALDSRDDARFRGATLPRTRTPIIATYVAHSAL